MRERDKCGCTTHQTEEHTINMIVPPWVENRNQDNNAASIDRAIASQLLCTLSPYTDQAHCYLLCNASPPTSARQCMNGHLHSILSGRPAPVLNVPGGANIRIFTQSLCHGCIFKFPLSSIACNPVMKVKKPEHYYRNQSIISVTGSQLLFYHL